MLLSLIKGPQIEILTNENWKNKEWISIEKRQQCQINWGAIVDCDCRLPYTYTSKYREEETELLMSLFNQSQIYRMVY